MLVSNIKSDFTFENFRYKVQRKYGIITLENLELVAMVTPDNLGNQK